MSLYGAYLLVLVADSNPAQSPPGAKPPRFHRWHGWLYKRIGRWHPIARHRIVAYAKASLAYHGKMVYSEGPSRSELFHRPRGKFAGASADCSQYSATLAHWSGVTTVTDKDYTGTLCHKGVHLLRAEPGCFVFFGAAPYVHMAVMVSTSQAIGFGDQAAPNQSSLAGLLSYFSHIGHPGHEFRDLT